MHLQRIEIQGFKSFAQKTVFDFPEFSSHDKNANSITAIVGPNGSGKSNVSDAIRWVLGEQSLKLIRCKKSDDVIFGGSEKKARQGFAEVSLYMNNEDKELPVDFSELVITRRVYRNGETEYLINRRAVRLYDVLILLAKANFGQRSYSIIGQGMVDHIINISPFERKDFFDEATGVKQYQIKRDQSVNRLRRSRENLDQTNKVLAELEPRLRLLTRQIKKLEMRQTLEKELRGLQGKYYNYRWTKLQADKQREEEKFSISDALKKDLEIRLNEVQNKLAFLARQESRKDIFNNLQKDYNKLQGERNDLMKELTMVKGKMSLEYVKFGKQNLSWLEDKKEELERRIKEIIESTNNLSVKVEYRSATLVEQEGKYIELTSDLVVLRNNLQVAEENLLNLKSGAKNSHYLDAVRAVLRQKDSIKGIFGTVSQLGATQTMYETALAIAAGNRLSAVVVQSDEVAVRCINFLKERKLGSVIFIPLNKIQASGTNSGSKELLAANGAIGFAVELLSFDEKYKKAFQFVFGSTIVVDNLENAKLIGVGRERMVTLDGDVMEKTGMMRGGYRREGSVQWAVLGDDKFSGSQDELMREIAVLKNKIEEGAREREGLEHEINESRIEKQVNETKEKGLANDLLALQKEKEKIEIEINENKISPDDQDKYLKDLEARRKGFEFKLEELDTEVSDIRKKLDVFNLEEEKKKEEVFALQSEMQKFQMKLNEVSSDVNTINIIMAKLETKREDLEKEAIQEVGPDFKFIKSEIEALNVDELWFNISKIRGNLDQIGGIDVEIIAEHKEVSERYEFLSTQVNDLDKAIHDLEKIVGELDELINKQFDSSFKKINKAFEKYFEKIFNGGKAKLELVQKEKPTKAEVEVTQAESGVTPNDDEAEEVLPEQKSRLLNTGIDIMVAPPNKKISNIAILSGGERTMTSLALICAIIESNPSPFIVMDEVEAALDEANSHKFASILQELSYKAQFVIITHNRVTMHVADVLYGVAMGEDGVSKTLSLKLTEAQKQAE